MLTQLRRMCLHPLGRTQQRRLFAIPEAIDNRALRMPALLQQLSQPTRLFQLRAGAGERIAGSVHPGIMVVATNYPLIGKSRTRNRRDHIVERLAVPVEADGKMCHRHARADLISKRQAASPTLRHQVTA